MRKFTFSAALALTCALLIMGGALAAGLSGAWNMDAIEQPTQLSQGGNAQKQENTMEDVERNSNNILERAQILEALFDGRTLRTRVRVDGANNGSSDDLTVSFRVNGQEPALITGWATAYDGYMLYDCLFECEPAEEAVLSVDLTSAQGEGTLGTNALRSNMSYYALEQVEGIDGLTGGAVAGEGFGCALLVLPASQNPELAEWLMTATLEAEGGARVSSRIQQGATLMADASGGQNVRTADLDTYVIKAIMFDELPDELVLHASGADGTQLEIRCALAPSEVDSLTELAGLSAEQLSIELLDSAESGEYLCVEYELSAQGGRICDSPDARKAGELAVTQTQLEAGELVWSSVERVDEGTLRYLQVYRGGAQGAVLTAQAQSDAGECTALLELAEPEDDGRMRARDLAQVSVPDELWLMGTCAIELDGALLLGARYRSAEEGAGALELSCTAQEYSTSTLKDDAGNVVWQQFWARYDSLPEDGSIALKLKRAGMEEDGEVALRLLDVPEMSVIECARNGEYVYALVEVSAGDGVNLGYSALGGAALGAQTDMYIDMDAEMEALLRAAIGSSHIGSEGAIGGADGPTSICLNEEPDPEVQGDDMSTVIMGGADGPTSIYVTGDEQDADASVGIIGGADGPTSIYVAGELPGDEQYDDASVGIIGGADGATSVVLSSHENDMAVTQPRMLEDGQDITLCAADVTGAIEGADGVLRLMLVGRARGQGQMSVELCAGSAPLSMELSLPEGEDFAEVHQRVEGSAEAADDVEIEYAQVVELGALKLLEVKLSGAELEGAGAGERFEMSDGMSAVLCTGDALPERLWLAGLSGGECDVYAWRVIWSADEYGEVDCRVYQLFAGEYGGVELEGMWRASLVAQSLTEEPYSD